MQVLYSRCCGLDVHQKTVVACVIITQANGKVDKSICTFATTTTALVALGDWLTSLQVSHVAMESTGVLWRPIYTVLEDQFELILAHAHEIKALASPQNRCAGLPVSFPPSPCGCCAI